LVNIEPQAAENDFLSASGGVDDSSWVLSLSDLMSLLLVFFLVWTTVKIGHLEKKKEEASEGLVQAPVMHIKDMSRLKGSLFKFSPRLSASDSGVILVLDQAITFGPGSARLSRDGQKMIAKIASILKGSTRFRLRIVGHGKSPESSSGSKEDISISLARASAVAKEFIYQGIDPGYIFVQGLGSIEADSNSEREQVDGLNRRVELIIEPAP